MPWLVEEEGHECPPNKEHHPIKYVCGDPFCDCVRDYDGEPYSGTDCHICKYSWPCPTEREAVATRKRQAVIDASMVQLETIGEPFVHVGYPSTGRTCILAQPYEGHNLVFDGLYDWITIIWEHGEGLSRHHKCTLEHEV